ncbi:MAG: 50S ribosomal protein L11 methyltransferase [Chitinophagales bacterium]|jgi:ribosomal protein L11 methyltransferase|nr:50S ribosomal protein L11 methyltransferase [Chitinophagales bacterium]
MTYSQFVLAFETQEELEKILNAIYLFQDFESIEETSNSVLVAVEDSFSADLAQHFSEMHLAFTLEKLKTQNWNQIFESQIQPIEIIPGEWTIRASFHPKSNSKNELIVDPKMSFGTGSHSTTKMMIESMMDLDFHEKTVLDFGSGTGILAFIARKLGAQSVVGLDNEPFAYENSIENRALNQLSKVDFHLTQTQTDIHKVLHQMSFDILLANITRNTLMHHVPLLKQYLKPQSIVMLSGFLDTDIAAMHTFMTDFGAQRISEKIDQGWACLTYKSF